MCLRYSKFAYLLSLSLSLSLSFYLIIIILHFFLWYWNNNNNSSNSILILTAGRVCCVLFFFGEKMCRFLFSDTYGKWAEFKTVKNMERSKERKWRWIIWNIVFFWRDDFSINSFCWFKFWIIIIFLGMFFCCCCCCVCVYARRNKENV